MFKEARPSADYDQPMLLRRAREIMPHLKEATSVEALLAEFSRNVYGPFSTFATVTHREYFEDVPIGEDASFAHLFGIWMKQDDLIGMMNILQRYIHSGRRMKAVTPIEELIYLTKPESFVANAGGRIQVLMTGKTQQRERLVYDDGSVLLPSIIMFQQFPLQAPIPVYNLATGRIQQTRQAVIPVVASPLVRNDSGKFSTDPNVSLAYLPTESTIDGILAAKEV